MLRIVIKLAIQVGALLLPVLLATGHILWLTAAVPGLQEGADPQRLAATGIGVLAVVMLAGFDYFDVHLPRRDARDFGRAYAEELFRGFASTYPNMLGMHIRINVMFARGLPRLRIGWFKWFRYTGFDPPHHHDLHLPLFCWQGLAGQALLSTDVQFLDLRTVTGQSFWGKSGIHRYWMFGKQWALTKRVRAILSVPLYRRPKKTGPFTVVGVINIDAISDSGADWLSENQQQLGDTFFASWSLPCVCALIR